MINAFSWNSCRHINHISVHWKDGMCVSEKQTNFQFKPLQWFQLSCLPGLFWYDTEMRQNVNGFISSQLSMNHGTDLLNLKCLGPYWSVWYDSELLHAVVFNLSPFLGKPLLSGFQRWPEHHLRSSKQTVQGRMCIYKMEQNGSQDWNASGMNHVKIHKQNVLRWYSSAHISCIFFTGAEGKLPETGHILIGIDRSSCNATHTSERGWEIYNTGI